MGKRSNFKRNERDFYQTPYDAVRPLLPHIEFDCKYIYPCAGNGALIEHLDAMANCVLAYDIEPQNKRILKLDALTSCSQNVIADFDYFITNPPWDRKILHPLIMHLSDIAPTWLLFDADWMHTRQSSEYISRCRKIVSVGRIKWIPGSKHTGKDNCAWYLFDRSGHEDGRGSDFWGRT